MRWNVAEMFVILNLSKYKMISTGRISVNKFIEKKIENKKKSHQ